MSLPCRARALMLLAILAGCSASLECGEEVCLEGQLCVLPASECQVSSTGAPCPDPDRACTDGRVGCLAEYFPGACIDAPAGCTAGPDCDCLRDTFDDDARLDGQRCLSVTGGRYVVVSR